MADSALGQFVQEAFGAETASWDESAIRALASKALPPGLHGGSGWLVAGDVNALWARWFLEGLADPQPYVDGRLQYAHLYKQVLRSVAGFAGQLPADEQTDLARMLAKLLWREVERRAVSRRRPADRELRLLLWELYPRCWICGGVFPEWARSAFLGEHGDSSPRGLPFVDFYKGRGARALDLRIEVEHVLAHSAGGRDEPSNLRLACRWCNLAKGARAVLYDAEGAPRLRRHPLLGAVSIPQPFWVVRLLAMRPRCEDKSGCDARPTNAELTVAPRQRGGAPNPSNLMVVCREHDPLMDVRLVAARYA